MPELNGHTNGATPHLNGAPRSTTPGIPAADKPTIEAAIEKLDGFKVTFREARIAAYRNLRLTDSRAHDLVIRATDCRAITPSQIPEVLAQWRNSAHAEFAPRNGWSLWNACSEVFKSVNPHTAIARCEALHGLFDGAAGVALAS